MTRFVFVLLLWLPLTMRAQTPVQVVTKVVEKDLPYAPGQTIRLTGQKADITLRGWNRPMVGVRLRLVARHPDKATAEREVAYHQYTLQTTGNVVELANRYTIPAGGGKPQSQLKAVYEVNVPEKALLTLTNSLGDVNLQNLSGDITLNVEFGQLILTDIGGKMTVTSSYNDITGQTLDANLTLKTEKADVVLRNLGGSCRFASRYGRLTLQPNPQTIKALSVEAARAEITVQLRSLTDFRYDVITTYADIRVPENAADEVGKFGGKQTFTYEPPGRKTELIIRTSYANVLIQTDKPFVNR